MFFFSRIAHNPSRNVNNNSGALSCKSFKYVKGIIEVRKRTPEKLSEEQIKAIENLKTVGL